MLFSSYSFILLFLPVCLLGFGLLFHRENKKLFKIFLLVASLTFYSVWKFEYLFLILSSIGVNYFISQKLLKENASKTLLILGVSFNLGLLGLFKYTDFAIENLNLLFGMEIGALNIILPLAISFFTFQQIAFLVDTYKGLVKSIDFLNYSLFVTFFPQLIAGPIVHHKEMMPQFDQTIDPEERFDRQEKGLLVFSLGLFKKIFIADYFAVVANSGFDRSFKLSLVESWMTSLSYTFQLYFDFSGYSDMAIGLGLIFGIILPQNFNSPYKAVNIQDFWRRWHMTLSHFLRDYLYIPMGGSRCSEVKIYRNLFLTFFLGGLWHGASWMFVIWGSLHGIALVLNRAWGKLNIKVNRIVGIIITFLFANICWIFFRATSVERAMEIFTGMFNPSLGFKVSNLYNPSDYANYFIPACILIWGFQNTYEMIVTSERGKYRKHLVFASLILLITFIKLLRTENVEFIYFNF